MSTTALEFAVRRLERSLGVVPPAGEHGRPLVENGQTLAVGLAELGVLSADEAQEWHARFEHAARPLVPAAPEVRARAGELLERELEAQPSAPAVERRERFTEMLHAFLETGAVGWDQNSDWIERLDATVPKAPTTHTPLYEASELRAVAVGPADRLGGLRITSAELFNDCVILRWHLVVEEDPAWRGRVFPADHGRDLAEAHGPNALADDLGTSYVALPIDRMDLDWLGLRQQPEVLRGASVFLPQVPEGANRLSVSCPAGNFEMYLRAAR